MGTKKLLADGASERRRQENKIGELVAHKGQLEANIRQLAEKQLKSKRLSAAKLREVFCIDFMMGAMKGEIEVTRNEYGKKETGYEILRPIDGGMSTAKLVVARTGLVIAVRGGDSFLNPVFLLARPFSIVDDEHKDLRQLLDDTLKKYMKAYMYVDYLSMPYTR